MKVLVKRGTYYGFLATILFIQICDLYYHLIGDISFYPYDALWNRPGNINDHFIYAEYGGHFKALGFRLLDNNFGMYWLYHNVKPVNKQLYAHIVNVLCIAIAAASYFRICTKFNLPNTSYLTFFLNTSFLYFSILINKDAISIAIILVSLNFAIRKRYLMLLMMLIPAIIVRQQLAFFIVTFFFGLLLRSGWILGLRMRMSLYSIIILSIAAIGGAIALRIYSFIGESTLGDGLTGRMMEVFTSNPILSPLSVPLRLLLYIYDMYLSFGFIENGVIDVAKVLRIPALVYIGLNILHLLRIRTIIRISSDHRFAALMLCAATAFAGILFNPQINARYATILLPIVILMILALKYKARWVE